MTGARPIDQYDLVILDLDGVVYLGTEPIPGAVEAIGWLRAAGRPVAYATNNAARRPEEVGALLTSLGVPATAQEVVTSGQAAATVLAERLPAGSAVLVVGTEALRTQIEAVGLTPVVSAGDDPVAVVQGYGPAVGWAELAEACVAIRAGALWLVTNADRTFPSVRGPLPGNGALVAALRTALSRAPDAIVGKPEPGLFDEVVRRTGTCRPLVIGDRLDTDIEGAVRAGLDSLLVLTGVSSALDLLAAPPGQRPTLVAADLTGLPAVDTSTGGWRVDRDGAALTLGGDGTVDQALRALCDVAWIEPFAGTVRAAGGSAADVLRTLKIAG